jgi:uncharacterized protein (DUF488 family)
MLDTTIYSIGHGNKKIHVFLAELKAFNIQYLLDIRSKPYSKWNPHFNKDSLEEELSLHGVVYVFVGESLGGLPKDTTCYDHNGKVVYDFIKNKDFFLEGMQRVIKANEKRINVALMCSESKPEECHRSKLIGQELLKEGISIKHIAPGCKIKSQQTVMNELTKGKNTTDLFGNEMDFTSRKSY